MAANPPDILLTNFMMLELLMTRQNDIDKAVMRNAKGLRFLVLDELHTYRGRQGADVALLVRRVREALADKLICIGTSATMATEGTEDGAQRRRGERRQPTVRHADPVPQHHHRDPAPHDPRAADRSRPLRRSWPQPFGPVSP